MRRWRVAGLLVVLLAVGPVPSHLPSPALASGGPAAAVVSLPHRVPAAIAREDLEQAALRLLNAERALAGLSSLVPDAGIRTAARRHGRELFASGVLSHRSRDGRWPAQRLRALGIRTTVVGENLAYAADVAEAHRMLMASTDHRRNILSARYRRVGLAVLDGGTFGIVVVQDFSD
ncbi:MAG: CAP domain-containing protein [Armatimonadota bacterium]|nr:CAP domain-containing protein [Armatimonadota bacterium]MDR7452374.1 CAP domain-containing protein [Armatimonadota bacterium]MDR7466719.1 CAP domain-containing protein [Armatimonadota bacterium]MDR7492807.1 CAP domain-containing protein [Armatimonadota bacterium]MDR7498583.1 CAP domain-containing protein [Armatimonadota bacterium]